MALDLPCYVGDTVFAYFEDGSMVGTKRKGKQYHLFESTIFEIEIIKDRPEPIFTAIDYKNARYERFGLTEFGKTIFTPDQYYNYIAKVERERERRKKKGVAKTEV